MTNKEALEAYDNIYDFKYLDELKVNVGINKNLAEKFLINHKKTIRKALKTADLVEEMATNLDECLDLLEMMIGKQHALTDSAINLNVKHRRKLLQEYNDIGGRDE